MQRPRRTSEFHEDPTGIRRQSRPQKSMVPSPAAGGGTASKYASRQSRIAVPTRPSSQDRPAGTSLNPYLTTGPSSAAKRGGSRSSSQESAPYLTVPSSTAKRAGATPQKTPLSKPSANRVLFTAEKPRTAGGNSIALHNDKKWVQEQTQRITEHLLTQNTLGGGINTEFLNRGLRQMSIKQFVAIINYFLGYIWGNRYTVGSNHVEDIVSILQKLQYPHAINKSWLKTPNTQHSFGNVIVLFDFLMDFVPTSLEEDGAAGGYGEILVFDLKDPEPINSSRMNDDLLQAPDLEFQQELLRNSEEGFMLWDKQKEDEYNCLQQQTCNLLIQKKSGFPDLETIDKEIQRLEDNIRILEKERPVDDRDAMKKKSKLSHELKDCRRQIKSFREEYENKGTEIRDINSRIEALNADVENLEMEVKSLHEILAQQKCSVEQRDKLLEELDQHKQMMAIELRTIEDLGERNDNKKVQYSRALKQFTDQVESFNKRMREIKFSDLMKSKDLANIDLELSLRAHDTQLEDLNKIIPILKKIKEQSQKRMQENKQLILVKQQHCKQLIEDLYSKLQPKLNELRSTHAEKTNSLKNLQQLHLEEELKSATSLQQFEKELLQADNTLKELQTLVEQKTAQVEEMKVQNEKTMQQAEERHKELVEQRKSFLLAYDAVLEECIQNGVLQQLMQQVEEQEKQLEDFRKELRNPKK